MVENGQSVLVHPAAPTQVLHKPLQDTSAGPDHVLAQRSLWSQQGPHEHLSQQAFIIEFFDDNPRKKRSQSFTHNPVLAEPHPTLKAKVERRKGGERPASVHGHLAPTQQVMVPLKGHSGPQRSSSLKRDKAEAEAATSGSSSSLSRPFGSLGKQSKLARDFHTASAQQDASPSRDRASTPPMSAPPVMVSPPPARMRTADEGLLSPPDLRLPSGLQPPGNSDSACSPAGPAPSPGGAEPKASQRVRTEEDDSLSDAGTYTIETEAQDREVEQARNMIDQVSSQVSRWAVREPGGQSGNQVNSQGTR